MSSKFVWYPSAPVQIAAASQKPTSIVADALVITAKSSHRFGFGLRTGLLRESYKAQVTSPTVWKVYNTAPYAGYVEFGTRNMTGQHHLSRAAQELAAKFPEVRYIGGAV